MQDDINSYSVVMNRIVNGDAGMNNKMLGIKFSFASGLFAQTN